MHIFSQISLQIVCILENNLYFCIAVVRATIRARVGSLTYLRNSLPAMVSHLRGCRFDSDGRHKGQKPAEIESINN